MSIDWPEVAINTQRPIQRSQANVCAFLESRGIKLRHNAFTRRDEIARDGRNPQPLDDAILREIRLEADAVGLSPKVEYFNDVIFNEARRNSFHPVLAYLDRLQWDGKDRLDRLAARYLGADDTALHRQFIRSTLIAAVRRIRSPGSKFDNLLVIEGAQGAGKSSFVKALASEAWFSDSLHIGTDPKETIEQTSGKWICELGELVGLGKKDRERVKAFLSRTVDSARLSYQRLASDAPRQFILIGTSNSSEYLTDTTGNRRFWPIRIGTVDLDAIRRDRDQIWAEAAYHEGEGESTELPPELWDDAAAAQECRLNSEPWFDELDAEIGERHGAVRAAAVWSFLGIATDRRDPHMAVRIGDVMRRLGFEKDKRRSVGFPNPVACFVREGWGTGAAPWIDLPTGGR
ncbi:MAG: virulence-associated E family protein [Xanthobacteraceae bacterium]|nr:virulence-associated E family protein [Xanthobacteraceae bacterium]